jgi:hypothetical protein
MIGVELFGQRPGRGASPRSASQPAIQD